MGIYSPSNPPKGFYIYAYLRIDGSPYYIGKGKAKRAWKPHSIQIPQDNTRIIIMESELSEIGALALERRYILWYGRKDNGTGMLRNMSDGGDGPGSGRVPWNKAVTGKDNAQYGQKAWNKGIPMTPEAKKKMMEANAGKPNPMDNPIHRAKQKAAIRAASNTPESKAKRSAAALKRWANQKANSTSQSCTVYREGFGVGDKAIGLAVQDTTLAHLDIQCGVTRTTIAHLETFVTHTEFNEATDRNIGIFRSATRGIITSEIPTKIKCQHEILLVVWVVDVLIVNWLA